MSEMNQGRQYDDIIIFVFQKHFLMYMENKLIGGQCG